VHGIIGIVGALGTDELDWLVAYLAVLFYLQGVSTVSAAIYSQELLII
jgi:hypothetical protein